MTRVNRVHRTTACFCFVSGIRLQPCKRPTVHPPTLFPPTLLGARANVRQMFKYNRAPRWRGLHDLSTQNVITITAKSCAPPAHLAQVALGAFRTAFLQVPRQIKVATFNRFPAPLAQKLSAAGNGWMSQDQRQRRSDCVGWLAREP